VKNQSYRLRNIISLIEDRKKYLEDRKLKHKRITGSLVELTTFLGEDKLSDFKNRLNIIEKYEDNKVKQEKIIKEMKSLDIKISEASRNVKANTRLNESLENKMIKKIDNVLEEFNLYSLVDQRSDITKKQESLKYALDMAKDNLKSARSLGDSSYIIECDSLLSEVTIEYSKYNEELNILKLIDIYDKMTSSYEELLTKREKIDDMTNYLNNIILLS
jgi:Trp operon repressor